MRIGGLLLLGFPIVGDVGMIVGQAELIRRVVVAVCHAKKLNRFDGEE
jgi:hypothetical protein